MRYDVVITGGGLGGLQCGFILAKKGMNVCVLEKNSRTGGCMQTFRRDGHLFDTGFHYVGGLDEGQPLHRLFSYFGLTDLPWKRLDENGFDEIILNGESFMYVNGYERFAEYLSERFPQQRENLKRYVALLKSVSDNIFDAFNASDKAVFYEKSLFARSAYEYLRSEITDPLLRNVLSGASLKMELNPSTLPLYPFAQINSAFIQSAWRLRGGGSQITDSLADSIKRMGGTVRTNAEVTSIIEENRKIAAVEINNSERIEADFFIADIHPSAVLSLIKESEVIRNVFRKRIDNLENTFGFFTVQLALPNDTVPYINRNIFIFENADDVWNYADYSPEKPNTCAMVATNLSPVNSIVKGENNATEYASTIDILTPMYKQEVEQWKDTTVGHRGADYEAYKACKAEALINLAASHGELREALRSYKSLYTSTILTYRDYTGTPDGSAYGIRKNYNSLLTTVLSPRTPEPNLFLTGQNLNIHGVLGVSMTSFLTCAEIVGKIF
ncbi:MAG: NAD(P)/FAD-dependent oxidoreductase [Tannerella sp.]|jgi:all-trans-retinol 13,14-reductase|nr:NAD(P)/FAD-dependent oxidoreductase [Tannerella sp.]